MKLRVFLVAVFLSIIIRIKLTNSFTYSLQYQKSRVRRI